ncbi:MAG: UPF0182 family protein [Dehalococcoidia bacterium]|nr:MAG: UPF0182 family protein [Dehalococcoidia bacterium]
MGFHDDGEERGNLGPPPEIFRFGGMARDRRPPAGALKWVGLAAAAVVIFLTLDTLKSIYVDVLWFTSVGFGSVYKTVVMWQVVLFVAGTFITVAAVGGNIWLARRLAPQGVDESFLEEVDPEAIRRLGTILLIAGTIFLGLILGAAASGAWQTLAAWRNAVEFGRTDPQFNRDISFYLFTLPAWHAIRAWVLGVVTVSLLGAGAVYALTMSLQRFELNITRAMRIHLSILVAILLLLITVGSYLAMFDLVTRGTGIVYGAMYTDVNARLPVRYLLVALGLFATVVTAINPFMSERGYRAPGFALGLWVFAGIVGGVLYPSTIQRFSVEPNERQKEEQFIGRNIEATRFAFGLDKVEESQYPANQAVTPKEFEENPETIRNIRLLDPIPLLDTFNQIQAIRQFYTFRDVDVDRYNIGGRPRQVMVAARELDVTRAQDRNWTRERLQLTHGFGAVVSPVNEVREEGLPILLTSDIPPKSDVLPLTPDGSRIYFGELTNHYVVGRSSEPEFDYPLGEGNAETHYVPDRGIRMNSIVRRAALAWQLGDQNLLISERVTADSRLLMRRNITERVSHVAPWLHLDSDPYAVILDGKVMWLMSAYTTTTKFPYSQPREGGVNYIRNSVTVTVDAQTGDMRFYLQDPTDPIASTWAKVFPGLLHPMSELPPGLREHLRYPLDLFKMQSQTYLRYHITDANVLFIGEDAWNIPTERFRDQEQPVEPYYVVMSLPRGDGKPEGKSEFVLIMPFTPRQRQNTVAWLAGRSDGDLYGGLRGYRFPTEALVFGPAQIEARIDQNPGISAQLTLWNQSGSQVIRGNLLMIPVGSSFLFVEPIYLQAENSRLPELVRVVVANGNNVAMEKTLTEAIEVLLGKRQSSLPGATQQPGQTPGNQAGQPGAQPTPAPTPAAGATPRAIPTGDLQKLLEEAQRSQQTTQAELDRLKQILDAIQRQLGPTPTPTPSR